MTQEAISGVSPVGRIIWGSVQERVTTDYDGKPYEAGKGPYQFGFAVRKDDPGVMGMMTNMFNGAIAGYPNNAHIAGRIQAEWQSGFSANQFAFKIKDGDKPNAKGQVNENARGCWVFAFSTTLDLKCCDQQNREIDRGTIERGFFVDIHYSTLANGNTDRTAGVYLNPNVVRLIAYGEKIIGGIDPDTAFAGHAAPTNLPPGASLTPLAPTGGMPGMPAANPTPQPGATMPGSAPNVPTQAPAGYAPQPAAPVTGYPSSPTNAGAPGAVPTGLPGVPSGVPAGQMPPATVAPGNPPQSGFPGVQPHTQFVNGPGMPGQ